MIHNQPDNCVFNIHSNITLRYPSEFFEINLTQRRLAIKNFVSISFFPIPSYSQSPRLCYTNNIRSTQIIYV